MLNRDALIEALIQIEGKDKTHEQMFQLRKELQGLGLVALGERYRAATKTKTLPDGKDPYELKAA